MLLVERGLAESRQKAQAIILSGGVFVGRQKVEKTGALVSADAAIELSGKRLRYASRAGLKLEGALADFEVSAAGKICLDIGASTGGFTDCLLQHGAQRVYAVDVSINQLAWKLERDRRVVKVQCNSRNLRPRQLGEPVDLVTVDVSFISVSKILPAITAAARSGTDFLILVKPQFELERGDIGKGGIVRDPRLHERAIERVKAAAEASGLLCMGVRPSHLPGREGNLEFFLHARFRG